MVPELVLLPSPLLGPAVWAPVAEGLARRGWRVRRARVPSAPVTAQRVVETFLESVPEDAPVVLVAHSNAGLFVPVVAEERDVVALVLLDAALPPAEGSTALAPEGFRAFLGTKADEHGVLPAWTTWWDDADVVALFPSSETRRSVEAEQVRLPLAYFDGSLPVPRGWLHRPSGYVAFGDTYAEERQEAERWGWPTETLEGQHLHMLVAPEDVTRAVHGMLLRLGVSPAG